MADAKTRDELEAEWWAAWWAGDFSWAGLADKPIGKNFVTIHGGLNGEQNLQDYWHRDPASGAARDDAAMRAAGELEECDGVVFHVAHLPPKTKAGAPTWKQDLKHQNWQRLEALLGPRLAAGAETKVDDFGDAEGPDGRAQLAGCVLRSALAHPRGKDQPLHVEATRTATLGAADYAAHNFGPGTSFDSATFNGEASLHSATFNGVARFVRAIFNGVASFHSATFNGVARFPGATFNAGARFDNATVNRFAGFSGATFNGEASFPRATFNGVASFPSATFNGLASFDDATFNGAARFVIAAFNGEASFVDAKFKGKAHFEVKAFARAARFARCLFDELVWFDGAAFKGDMDFTAAVFDKLASFEKITWPEDCRHWHSAFDDVLFRSKAQLTGAGFRSFAAFDGATLERGLQFDDPETEEAANKTFRAEHKQAMESSKRDGEGFEPEENERRKREDMDKAKPVSKSEIRAYVRAQREERLRQLERGCRVLKQAMEFSSNKSREQMLYRFELQARRAQRKLRFGEKTFSDLYGAASDYGASMWRPFAALAVLIAVFAAGFWGIAAALDPFVEAELLAGDWQAQFWSALNFSWSNVFKPLSALSSDVSVKDGSMIDLLLTQAGDGWAFLVRALATLQSLLAIVLAFLFALAVRRRFQIS